MDAIAPYDVVALTDMAAMDLCCNYHRTPKYQTPALTNWTPFCTTHTMRLRGKKCWN